MFDILSKFNAASSNQINECGMPQQGVTLQTSSAGEMAEILRALAGVEAGAKPAPEMPPMPPMGDMPPKDDMPSMAMKLPMPAPEEAEMEEYDNEPEEEYQGVDAVLPSGTDLHRKKDAQAIRVKDPAVKTESIKDRLWAALNEKKENLK